MSTPPAQQQSRFKAPSNLSTSERLSTNTVGLVALSDFRKRRAEVLEQQEREAREALRSANGSGASTPKPDDRSRSATPSNAAEGGEGGRPAADKKAKRRKKALVSFGDDDEEGEGEGGGGAAPAVTRKDARKKQEKKEEAEAEGDGADGGDGARRPAKITANAAVGIVPRALTKAALRREAAEREALRKEFLALQEGVKSAEIAVPFVFYDGTNTPGGTVRVRKGEFVWVFLDKSRKLGADLGVGGERKINVRREWARVGVDDLLLVRGTMIIPHVSGDRQKLVYCLSWREPLANFCVFSNAQHYEFYFFIMNKTTGPGNVRLFNYSAEVPTPKTRSPNDDSDTPPPVNPLSSARGGISRDVADISTLEGVNDDPSFTKVVDRRWYERNKHIYPASVWQEFDPEKDYTSEVRKDLGGNTFFFSR